MKRLFLIFSLAALIIIGFSLWQSQLALQQTKKISLNQAQIHAQRASFVPQVLSQLTFKQVPSFELWRLGLKIIIQAQQTLATVDHYSQNFFQPQNQTQAELKNLKTSLQQLEQLLYSFNQQLESQFLLSSRLKKFKSPLKTVELAISNSLQLLSGQHTYLLLLQNSEELRATGGFLGSYAKLGLKAGQLEEFLVEDIYVPAGQFEGFVPAPTGAKEYLSGGQGLRLPDANWHPDFPTSAQRVMSYFAFSQEQNLEGVVAINLPVAEKILELTGPIELSDYQTTVTPQNLSDVARADRDQFFPGSQQKKHFMSRLFKELIFRLENFTSAEKAQLAQILAEAAKNKDLLFYSTQTNWQKLFHQLDVAGNLKTNQDLSLMLVESNVGINKANQHLDRAVRLQLKPTQGQLEIEFTNHNLNQTKTREASAAARHLNYINYQRLIMPPQVEVQEIVVNNQLLDDWDETLITNQEQDQFKQIGFLMTVPTESTRQVKIKLSWPTLPPQPTILLQKQPGLPSTNYQLQFQDQTFNLTLKQDQVVEFN